MLKKLFIIGGVLAIIGLGVGGYMYFMPHRDVQATKADMQIEAKVLVNKFLTDATTANKEFLSQDGESKILIVTGAIHTISEDGLGQKVILLKNENDIMGVSCTFTIETGKDLKVNVGDNVKIKGVIRSGAEYDEDLELAEDAIMEKCAIVL